MIFLIDFENVSNGGFLGIENLTEQDSIIVFYSEAAAKISMDTHRRLELSKASKEYIPIKAGGKNALDFQLSTYLGYLIALDKEATCCIVSKDAGYDCVIDFWSQRVSASIIRCENLNMKTQENLEEMIQNLFPDKKTEVKTISKILTEYKTKQGINNALVKNFGSETAGNIYKIIKPLLNNKK